MFYFPKSDDARALKILIKKGIIEYEGRDKTLRKATITCKGSKADEHYSYDYNYSYDNILFDDENIYKNGEQISLAELLLHTVIKRQDADDTVIDIIKSRNLTIEPIVIGETNTVSYEGESYDSEDTTMMVYEVVENE